MDKKCKRCGMDVSQSKRVKDPHGNYYCEPCYAAAKNSAAPTGKPRPAAAPTSVSVTPLSDELDFSEAAPAQNAAGAMDEYDLAPTEEKKEEPKAPCSVCKQFKLARVVQFIDGESTCNTCLAQRKKTTPAKSAERKLNPESLPSPFVAFMTSGPGIAVTAVASVLFSFSAMWLIFDGTMKASGIKELFDTHTLTATVAMYATFYNIILAVALLASMLMVDKLLGGVGFGTISGVIWKSMLITTIATALRIFSMVSEGVNYSNFAVGPALNLAAFMLLFKLDFFESMLLSAVNWVIAYIAGMAIAAFLLTHAPHGDMDLPEIHRGPAHTNPHDREGSDEEDEAPEPDPATKPAKKATRSPTALPQTLALSGIDSHQGRLKLLCRAA